MQRALGSSLPPHPPCLFLIRWLVHEWRGLRLLLPSLMNLSSFGRHTNTCTYPLSHTAAGAHRCICRCTQKQFSYRHLQSELANTGIHVKQREHEPAHMLACTLQRRPILLSCFCSLSVSLIQHRQLLDSSSDLPCLIVSCDLSCEISDTQTDACLF